LAYVTMINYGNSVMSSRKSEFPTINAFNINSAQHIYMAFELRLRYEHEIMTREKFERKFTDSVAVIQQRDTEVGEVASLTTQNAGLLEKVYVVELERDSLKSQVVGESKMREAFVSQQDAAERHFGEHAAELDARIADVRRDMENDLYLHMLTVVAGQRWVIGHGFRSAVYKCARSGGSEFHNHNLQAVLANGVVSCLTLSDQGYAEDFYDQ
ncbi:hypothetical protein Tco_0459412, partial [Tanacetum coccineum]